MRSVRARWIGLAGLLVGAASLWAAEAPRSSTMGDDAENLQSQRAPTLERVAALGRIEPGRGVIRVAGPPRPTVVIERLLVEEGDAVRRGQAIASLAGIGVQQAEVARLAAELANADRELKRRHELHQGRVLSESDWQAVELSRDVARARLTGAEAELELSTVRSPIDGRVLKIHAREGERVGADGIAEVGSTDRMYAVAEVYETDIGRVQVGRPARVRSSALAGELEGVVEQIGLEIGKQDTLDTDPVADVDARVVEVRVRILDAERVAALTNARVDVVIEP
jgi:HlyD family secretion protein